tara:strand:+ start:2358 stop:2543 length:186 start_codon:yes stop_codon:yes gene_type:complete
MKLSEWLQNRSLTQSEAARWLGISQPAVSLLCSGSRMPSLPLMQKIFVLTDGEVSMADFNV